MHEGGEKQMVAVIAIAEEPMEDKKGEKEGSSSKELEPITKQAAKL